jgi:ABC-2 type transport system permease protein
MPGSGGFMRKTIHVMRHEIRSTLRRKSFLILALGLPLMLALIALVVGVANRDATPEAVLGALGAGDTEAPEPEGYVDEGGLIRDLPADVPEGWLRQYPDEDAAQAALQAGEIDAYYLIPADYVRTGEITYVRLRYSPLSDKIHSDWMEWVLLYNLVGDADLAAQVWDPLEVEVMALAPDDPVAREGNWFVELFPTIMTLTLYLAILIPSGMLVNAVTDEKKNRIMEVLMSSVSPYQMIAGKIVALGILGLLQLAVWIGMVWLVARFGGRSLNIPAGAGVPGDMLVWALVYGLLGYAIYGAQMAGVGALAPDLKDARTVTFIIMVPLIVVYMFLMAIVLAPDGPFAVVVSLFPLTSPVAMIARMTRTTVPLWQAALAAVLQLLAAILIVRLAARLFRAQYLLSGQGFSVMGFYRALLGRA